MQELTYGDVVVVPPGIPHHAVIHDTAIPYRRFIFWISQGYCEELHRISPDYTYLMRRIRENGTYIFHYDPISFNELQSKAFALIVEKSEQRFGKEAKTALCVNDLVLYLSRSVYEMEHLSAAAEESSLYQQLVLYIERHLEEDLTLDTLAAQFYVSKFHIAHIFKEHTGISVHQFIIKKRLAACRTAILGGSGISEVGLTYGFSDYSSFFRAFKKEYGMSPREYREVYSKPEIS